ncbi:MAG: hypothetical protein C3F02_04950 [Parcubacteria group bacterium]|nr:MAG: hypothetical protein C3F02_04950 [Parcubacteria group bacterium]
MTLRDKIKKFPDAPGVYRFLDARKKVLYVGRATSLKKRLVQYFQKNINPRIAEMVAQAKNVKVIPLETILDTVVLEANLIKKYWPKYNVLEKDDKSFVYIVIPAGDFPYPRLVRARELARWPQGKNHIFGPYNSQGLVKNALKIIRRIFPYSICRPGQGYPCFDYQVGLCHGVCLGLVDKKIYQKNIKNIILLLSGQRKRLISKLKKENSEQAQAFQHLQDVTLLTRDDAAFENGQRIEGYDISHLAGQEPYGSMVVFSSGVPDKSQYRLFKIKNSPHSDDLRALQEVLSRRLEHREWRMPDLIMIDGGKPQIDFISKLWKEKNVRIPIVGISKYSGDKLIFPANTGKRIKDLAQMSKNILLQVRDEAHRFSRKASRWKRRNR